MPPNPAEYLYPCHRRTQLVAVKDGIFHPNLPTFRRMDMDSVAQKLPDEHSRTTTTCTKDDFENATYTIFPKPSTHLSSLSITEAGREILNHYSVPEDIKKLQLDLTDYLSRPSASLKKHSFPDVRDLHFVGYGVRFVRPEISRSWLYTLRQEPHLDGSGQAPIPANIYARHRDAIPKYRMGASHALWRP